jgi:hypothetical protein
MSRPDSFTFTTLYEPGSYDTPVTLTSQELYFLVSAADLHASVTSPGSWVERTRAQ